MKKRRGKKCYPFVFRVRGLPRTNSIHFLKNGWRKDENLVDIFQRLRGIIYVLLSELCAKDSTTVEGITPSTLKISTESSVNSGARNQESGCKQRERERETSASIVAFRSRQKAPSTCYRFYAKVFDEFL